VKLKATKKTFFQERDHMPGFRNIIGVCYQELQTSKKISGGAEKDDTPFLENLAISSITYDRMTDAVMIN
jgi:hypothetical protein